VIGTSPASPDRRREVGILSRLSRRDYDPGMSDFFVKFPLDEATRDVIRSNHIEYALRKAMREATKWHLSLRCERGDHASCRNDGSSCLCRHHDIRAPKSE
jgi:hypothetical protein